MSKEAMKLALEALEETVRWRTTGIGRPPEQTAMDAITALREALAEQQVQQEPFGYFRYDLRLDAWVQNRAGITGTPFYTAPLPRQPLTEWQPIETAPKDGTMFMCWVHAVRWSETDEGQQYQQDVSQADFCWWRRAFDGVPDSDYFDNASGQIGDSQAITHWMPLLPAPEASHGIKGEA